jgi:hypothetical protein
MRVHVYGLKGAFEGRVGLGGARIKCSERGRRGVSGVPPY